METRERNSTNYNNHNQDSSPRLSTPPLIPSNTRRSNDTLNHLHHQGNNNFHHGFKLHREKLEPQRPTRDPNPDPNLTMRVSQTPAQPLPLTPLVPTSTPAVGVVVRYRECLKNHAANMGTHVLDGCGEFMPGGDDDTPRALKCAACECHRSFHRREVEGGQSRSNDYHMTHYQMAPVPPRAPTVHLPPAPPSTSTQQHRRFRQPMPPFMMAFGGGNGAPAESSSEDFDIFQTYAGVQLMARTSSKKRFRTKFSQEQKDKMFDFAERIGWKIQKQNEQDVLRFCNEVDLKKQVFKVWMHNNKLQAAAAKKK
ncbi:hypothetical protein QVD17_04963 [Tagetes erecta]|uniref:ZF-HD dimerization-type domain-containing protein n=1 Tax=Tagetes erecta TaxID=13708 RepID=A0AAD8LGI1_TARER|nr:hypothetical protein QVD17_04963 [Tagetes erecta]